MVYSSGAIHRRGQTMPITATGRYFRDETGRRRILRGVNLSGASKVPAQPPGATHLPDSLNDPRHVSFIGRPFPLEEADEHFTRLKHWGLDCLRFIVTWEALAHAGPGCIDEAYLDYLHAVLEKAHAHGLLVFIDPHQDVWSRFCGGDGAPAWTFEALGMEIERFSETGAALLHQEQPDTFPQLMWATNYARYVCFTMFTLFFGGRDFAPQLQVDGQNIQDYLQGHYCAAYAELARRLRDLPNLLGFGSMNEPSPGLLGVPDLRSNDHALIKLGIVPSPAQAIFLANGFAQDCQDYGIPLVDRLPGQVKPARIDPQGATVWRDGFDDVWRAQGIWDVDSAGNPRMLRPGHFARADFLQDHLKPFTDRFASAIHAEMPAAFIFIEAEPMGPPPNYEDADRLVYAPHFYDGVTLLTRRFHPQLNFDFFSMRPLPGEAQIRRHLSQALGKFRHYADEALGEAPILIGEIGIPFDLNGGGAFRSGDFSRQAQALDYSLRALDDHLYSYTLWNYTPDNTNERGDQWNSEDLSIFSRDQQSDPADINSGGRALAAIARPYARKVAGDPLTMRYDRERGIFTFTFKHDSAISEPTEIFVPNLPFPDGYRVEVSDGEYEVDSEAQRVLYRHSDKDMPHMIRIVSNSPAPEELSPWGKLAMAAAVALVALALLRRLLRR
ncbi:MAG: glycoside hydrolase family 5 protein [Chloroflexi bacterium]|nr:glycoside hydrolase family 5 protein [Chloroflexota bacterium]MXX83528.1 glycoside hydrolase family 5 protein [Chloroflexota bacterium]MYA93168.1 glycoside hydrolase family 5 protein [Chloroflexota bacterium]MYC56653.1 glycoside hydrolase family 5 protein [Chloroflexota bacterium]MYD39799.1 glycoside hydrolase family 5 protein [Chloroflexota bacterium]